MSVVGNSLENRQIEYFFAIMKTEVFYCLDYMNVEIDEVILEVENNIKWYSNVRI